MWRSSWRFIAGKPSLTLSLLYYYGKLFGHTDHVPFSPRSLSIRNLTLAFLICCVCIASDPPGTFTDITASSGVRFQNIASHTSRKYLPETMGSGVALFDYDNDGRLDIFLVNGAPLEDPTTKGTIPRKAGPKYWDRLYHQKSDGTFEDVTEKAGLQGTGYGMGVAAGDYDNDGFEDLYVTAYGENHLYHNNQNGTFTDVSTTGTRSRKRLVYERGVGGPGCRRQAGPGGFALPAMGL